MLTSVKLDQYCTTAVEFVKARMGEQLRAAYLIGSYYKGIPRKESDVDILFVFTDDNDWQCVNFNIEFHHHMDDLFGVPLHPIYVTQSEYTKEIQGFRENRVIYEA